MDDEVVEGKYYYYYFIIRDRPPGVSAMPRHLRVRMTMVKLLVLMMMKERLENYFGGIKKEGTGSKPTQQGNRKKNRKIN